MFRNVIGVDFYQARKNLIMLAIVYGISAAIVLGCVAAMSDGLSGVVEGVVVGIVMLGSTIIGWVKLPFIALGAVGICIKAILGLLIGWLVALVALICAIAAVRRHRQEMRLGGGCPAEEVGDR